MIFKQVDEILSGRKTQTRRVCKRDERHTPAEGGTVYSLTEVEYTESGRLWSWDGIIKWQVGRTYAVQPGRGKPAVWWKEIDGERCAANTSSWFKQPGWEGVNSTNFLVQYGWQPLRIRITAIRQEPLQVITEADAKAEGVGSVEEYRELWQRINSKTKGTRWQDNPLVYVMSFEVVKEARYGAI